MADSPKPSSRRPSNSSLTSPRLQYPTFPPLSASVEEWLSRSRPTIMTSEPPSEHSSSTKLLSESWATLSISDAHSEDGTRSEQTDIGSLIDQTSTGDVASLDDRSEVGENYEDHDDDQDSEEEDNDEEADNNDDDGAYDGGSISESQELPALYHRFGGDIEDSGLTAKAAFHQSTDSIEFIEPDKWPEMEQVELKHTVQIFEGVEAARLKEQLPPNQQNALLTATVQQTMTRYSLDIDQPFRVLYIGNPDFRTIVLDKIGDVLVSSSCSSYESSSSESSRYHVIPTSFGADAVPNFAELLPIHVQLIVDECLEASSDPRSGKPSTVSLKFKNRPSCTSYWTGSEYCLSSPSDWTLPDVAIFFVSSTDDAAAVETQHQARTFMERHGVPAMMISEKPWWEMTTELIPVNRHSLHMCLESRHSLGGEPTVLRRYPIDLPTFESIASSQLNRNLASLANLYPKQVNKVTAEVPKPCAMEPFSLDIEKYSKYIPRFDYLKYSDHAQKLSPSLRLLAITVISAIAITLAYTVVSAAFVYLSQFFSRYDISEVASPSSGISNKNIIPIETLGQNSLSVIHSSAGEVQSLRNQYECSTQLEELMGIALSPPVKQGKPDRFELQVIGDSHVILKPPRRLSLKKPKFGVSVTRYGNAIPYELSKLFEGVYSLNLDREDAYGLVNVTITTSKPPLEQTTQVDFGTPWLKIANWKRAASTLSTELVKDLNTAQTGLSKAYDRLYTDLQVAMGDVVKRSHLLQQEVDDIRGSTRLSLENLSLETRNAVLARSKQLSEFVRRDAVQPFWAVCSVFQEQTSKASTEAKDLVMNTWRRISSIPAPRVDLGTMMDRFRDARKSEALNKAQKRARGLVRRRAYDSGRRQR